MRAFEDLPPRQKEHDNLPDFAFLLTDTLLIFDNVTHKIKVVANAHALSTRERDIKRAYRAATERIERMIMRLRRPLRRSRPHRRKRPTLFTSNMSQADFENRQPTRSIFGGAIVQAVLSSAGTNVHGPAVQLYRALRVVSLPLHVSRRGRRIGRILAGDSVRCEEGDSVTDCFQPASVNREEGSQLERRL